jgi:hypothetical protein
VKSAVRRSNLCGRATSEYAIAADVVDFARLQVAASPEHGA